MNNTTGIFYNRISFAYPVINYFLERHRRVLIHEINKARPGKLLEIGVGNGSHLSLYIDHEITGIDISEGMLNKAKRFESDRITLLLMDGEHLLLPKAGFDYVVMSHVLAVVNDHDKLLKQVYRVLKPGGKLFILNHFTPDNWLQYIDVIFHLLSRCFHFKSLFRLQDIKGLKSFSLVSQKGVGLGSYFKLLIYSKP